MTHTVTAGDRKITYELTRKKVKNINLRIKPDGTVHVSASTAVTIAVIERFIRERADFILGAIDKFNAKNENRKTLFVSGEKLSLLGTQHILYVKKGIRNYAADSDGNITLYVADTDDYELKYKTYITWLRSQCLPLMTLLCKRAYDEHYGKLGIDFPTIKVKDMRSRWEAVYRQRRYLRSTFILWNILCRRRNMSLPTSSHTFCRQTTVQGFTQSLQGICLTTSRGKEYSNKLKQKQQETAPAVFLFTFL